MIVLFTDFGLEGPYIGQVQAVLHGEAPGVPVVNLFADAPAHAPKLAAYLLAAYAPAFPAGSVFLAVVDSGVGGVRAPAILEAEGRWYVGPENGLFAILARRAGGARWWRIEADKARLSASFHGRDLFAPAAAKLARGEPPAGDVQAIADLLRPDWPDDLARIVYVDRFGNAMTGLRAAGLAAGTVLCVGAHRLTRARTFSEVPPGTAFWYENANGLAEIAVNRGRADAALGLTLDDVVTLMR
ncbi:MAG: SAM-dependent chlorinase/fluorinase [Alphaproteobacteria bacterium]|nr:SAM-dependent chlorinase/fluorinase [Alphaproteobacteria bacterium]